MAAPMARTAGVLGSWLREESVGPEYGWRRLFVPDERLGRTPDDYLVETYVVEGDPRFERYGDFEQVSRGVLYDIDNVSDSTAQFSCGDSDWSGMIGENGCEDEYVGVEVFFEVRVRHVPKRNVFQLVLGRLHLVVPLPEVVHVQLQPLVLL